MNELAAAAVKSGSGSKLQGDGAAWFRAHHVLLRYEPSLFEPSGTHDAARVEELRDNPGVLDAVAPGAKTLLNAVAGGHGVGAAPCSCSATGERTRTCRSSRTT